MTDIAGDLLDVAGFRADGTISVRSLVTRKGSSPTEIVTTAWHDSPFTDGNILIEDVEPGPAEIMIRCWNYHQKWKIEVPDSPIPVNLWPLIDAGAPAPPQLGDDYIRSEGIARVEYVSQTEYAGIGSPDPSTMYVLYQG